MAVPQKMINCIDSSGMTAEITSISWERIWLCMRVNLTCKVSCKEEPDFFLVDRDWKVHAKMRTCTDICLAGGHDTSTGEKECLAGGYSSFAGKEKGITDMVRYVRVNVTNPGNLRCLPRGFYYLLVCLGQRVCAYAQITPALVPSLDNLSRCFLFKNQDNSYNFVFYAGESEDSLVFVMRVLPSYGRKGDLPSRRSDSLRDIFSRKWREALRRMYFLERLRHLKNTGGRKTVLFLSEMSDTPGDNLEAVRDRMRERSLGDKFYILESYHAPDANGNRGKASRLSLVSLLAKADFIFLDDYAPILDTIMLDKKTKVIQLWHAGVGFKSSGYSRWGHLGCPSPVNCHRQISYGICSSIKTVPIFSEIWGINDSMVIPTGIPRTDKYLDPDYRKAKTEELKKIFPIIRGKQVILFAPTYRGRNKRSAHYPYERIDFDALYSFCGDEYVVLFRMHPWVKDPVPLNPLHSCFLDVSSYPRINDLFYITDILITDYSSVIFEFSLMRKPMLFYAFDEVQYSLSRGFHLSYEKAAPGRICTTFEQLLEALRTKDFLGEKVTVYVRENFSYTDCSSTDRVIDWLLLGDMPISMKEALLSDANFEKVLEQTKFPDLTCYLKGITDIVIKNH